jgi:hypothetical protein
MDKNRDKIDWTPMVKIEWSECETTLKIEWASRAGPRMGRKGGALGGAVILR